MGQRRRRRKSKSAEKRNKSKVSQRSRQSVSQKPASQPQVPRRLSQPETSQSSGSSQAATYRWDSGVVEGIPSQPKTETSRRSARSRDSQSARNQPVSRKCHGGSVSEKPASQLEVTWRPQLGRPVASSKKSPSPPIKSHGQNQND